MGLLEVGSTLAAGVPVGNVELVYTCDDCERRTGDPYARIGFAVVARDNRDDEAIDDSSMQGWTRFYDEPEGPCTRAYCADCSTRRAGVAVVGSEA